jgi:DNA-directed RNA polymerase subunit M/transcription elongation factor TFIIS
MERRNIAKKALKTMITSSEDIKSIESKINSISTEENYIDNVYQIIGDINKFSTSKILSNIKHRRIGSEHPCFDEIRDKINEQDEFIKNPFKVEEGVLECNKCGSKRVYSYSKQTRSGDESSTTFANCVKCGAKWTYSG